MPPIAPKEDTEKVEPFNSSTLSLRSFAAVAMRPISFEISVIDKLLAVDYDIYTDMRLFTDNIDAPKFALNYDFNPVSYIHMTLPTTPYVYISAVAV